jgi:tetratricopeptide (TPR) repeat protein
LLRRFEESESAYERFLAIDPKSEEALSNLIALNVERFDLVRVHRYSLRLLELCPHSRVALQGLTLSAIEHGEYDTAAHHFTRLAKNSRAGGFAVDDEREGMVRYQLPQEVSSRLIRILYDQAKRKGT